GIEQSYLSKLESGKSYPSEDVFSSLMNAYKIEPSDLHDKVFAADLDRLRDISAVRDTILKKENAGRVQANRFLLAGVAALALGGACLGTALLATETEVRSFQYRLAEADPADRRNNAATDANHIDKDFRTLDDYRDVVFSETTPEGTLTWRFIGAKTETVQSPLRWFMIPALALILSAFGCFFSSYRAR
ncbi:MAG: helix-turn-helix transcriptional regulator, partial [Pseudomonadota bacterium]